MNYSRPRYDHWPSKLTQAILLMVLGSLVTQFWYIPEQRAQMAVLRQRMDDLEYQHMIMMDRLGIPENERHAPRHR
jgi:hypothetical protein